MYGPLLDIHTRHGGSKAKGESQQIRPVRVSSPRELFDGHRRSPFRAALYALAEGRVVRKFISPEAC